MRIKMPASAISSPQELGTASPGVGVFRAAAAMAQAYDPDHSKAWSIVRRLVDRARRSSGGE